MDEWKRYYHNIQQTKRSTRPKNILFIDVETNCTNRDTKTEFHTFRLAVGCLCKYVKGKGLTVVEWNQFLSPEALWGYVAYAGITLKRLTVVAHNIDYDARASMAFSVLPKTGFVPTFCIMARACTMFVWKKDKCTIEVIDNLNLWRTSLEKIGESVGLPKLAVDFDAVEDDELFVYCRRDVEILVKLWQEWFAFLDEHDLGSFGFTAARQSFNSYRHRFMPCTITVHDKPVVSAMERDAYRGGRVECFFVGKLPPGKYFKLDVNGLYAQMMLKAKYPRKLLVCLSRVCRGELAARLERHLVIAEVVVSAHEPVYAHRVGGRSCYPTGTFLTTLTTPELKWALEHDEVRGIGRVAVYEPADLFSGYVEFFHGLRQEYRKAGNDVQQGLCKLFLNSLQGKFGQWHYKQKVVGKAWPGEIWQREELDAQTGKSNTIVCYGGRVLRQWQEGEGANSFPAIPAHVCAYGRMYMWSIINRAGRDHVFYTDTDSLVVDEVGYERLRDFIDPHKLGYLKLEGMAEDVEIMAKKDYRFGDLRVRKGMKANAVQLTPNVYTQWHFTTMKYGFREHNLDGVTVRKVTKQVRSGYVSGTVEKSGRVTPLKISLPVGMLLEYLTMSSRYNRDVWTFDPTWKYSQGLVAAEDHRERQAGYFDALFESAAQSLGPRPELPSSV